jgi:hypothetical protein
MGALPERSHVSAGGFVAGTLVRIPVLSEGRGRLEIHGFLSIVGGIVKLCQIPRYIRVESTILDCV